MKAHVYFEIQADNIDRAAQFYTTVFDWQLRKIDGLPIEYQTIETGGNRGGLLTRPLKAPAPGQGTNAFVCSFEVDDFDSYAQKILSNGGQIALPKFAVPKTCWQGYFIDTEGNTFGLFQVDENAG